MSDRIKWDRVEKAANREGRRMLWKPYGLPEILDPFATAFAEGVDPMPRWDIPQVAIVSAALTGALFSRRANPNQPITPDELLAAAIECVDAGATTVHVHVRDERGYNVLDPDLFSEVVDGLKAARPGTLADGCLVCAVDGEWEAMRTVLERGTLDAVPVNATTVYIGDSLFSKPVHMIVEKAKLAQEHGLKVQIAVYSEADIDNARRFLIDSGLVDQPPFWIVLPALPGCSPMNNPRQLVEGVTRMVNGIRDVDPASEIMVCAAGRASTYLTGLALMMGLHVRVGMEDSIWLWPHRDDLIPSNAHHVRMAVQLTELFGRTVATSSQYRELMGMSA